MKLITLLTILPATALALPQWFPDIAQRSEPSSSDVSPYSPPNSTILDAITSSAPSMDYHGPALPTKFLDITNFRAEGIKCETSDGSPRLNEGYGVANILKKRGKQMCRNHNDFASQCTKQASYKGGAASLCGNIYEIPCESIGFLVKQIVDKCKWFDYAGGLYDWGDGDYLPLHRSNVL